MTSDYNFIQKKINFSELEKYGNLLILNHIRDLINNNQIYDIDKKDIVAEAYINSNGRNNTVDQDQQKTTAGYINNKYNCYNLNFINSEVVPETVIGATVNYALETPINLNTPGYIYKVTVNILNVNQTPKIQILNSSSQVLAEKNLNPVNGIQTVYFNKSDYLNGNPIPTGTFYIRYDLGEFAVKGGSFTGNYMSFNDKNYTHKGFAFCTDMIINEDNENFINHILPTGKISNQINKILIKSLVAEKGGEGAIEHKLINDTEETEWINDGIITNINPFTNPPTRLITKLKRINETNTSIYGVGILNLT